MSQKVSKRTRRRTEDELDGDFKAPDSAKTKEENLKNISDTDITPDENGVKESASSNGSPSIETANGDQLHSPTRTIQTRSRSNTPLIKASENVKVDAANGAKDETKEENETTHELKELVDENGLKEISEPEEKPVVENGASQESEVTETLPLSNSPEMEALVLDKDEEEPIPELQFDENDLDLESEGSPGRCKTRRSQTRNMSTPKTPKMFGEQQETESKGLIGLDRLPDDKSESSTPKKITSNDSIVGSSESQPDENVDLNDTSDTYSSVSTDNISTRAVAGSDATRNVDLTYQDSGLFEENSYTSSPNRSLGETLRNLSSRRTIRPINEDYRRFVLKNSVDNKGDLYANYESVQRISVGIKRKNRSVSPEESKRFKKETSGLLSYFASPIHNFKNTFNKSSTPKLVAYERKDIGFDGEDIENKVRFEIGSKEDAEKKWCAIM